MLTLVNPKGRVFNTNKGCKVNNAELKAEFHMLVDFSCDKG